MKKIILIAFFLSLNLVYSQKDKEEKISIHFENISKIDVLQNLSEISDYDFYYIKEWVGPELISGNYKGVLISEILNDLFKGSVINYYIYKKNSIILTKNNLIYDTLPDGFYSQIKSNTPKNETIQPVLYNDNRNNNKIIYETVRIGKESKNNRKFFTLHGIVKHVNTNEPIQDLVIRVIGKNINSISDVNGFYSMKIPSGVNYIETKALGLEKSKKKVIIYNDGELNFKLKENSQILDEVIINSNQKSNIKEAVTGITKVHIEEIKSIPLVLGERDILKVATTLPGIKTAGEGASGYSVRGGKEDQNLILLDNAVIYNPSHFFGIFSALNPFTSGDVNIYKGNIPAEYGGRLSSVFEIHTKKPSTENFLGEASIGPVTSNLSFEIPIVEDKSGLIVGARGTYSDWVLKSIDDESISNSKASFYDVVSKYSHNINSNNSIDASAYYSKDAFKITSDSLYSYHNRLMSLKWNHNFNDKNLGSIGISNSEYKFNINFENDNINNFDLGYKINETEIKFGMKYLMNDHHKINYGVSSKLYVINPGEIKPIGSESIVESIEIPQERALESALFISDNFKINKKLLINAGFRYSTFSSIGKADQRVYSKGLPKSDGSVTEIRSFKKNEVIKTYGGPEIRASFRYFLLPSLSLKGSYNSSYQYIHSLSNNTTASPTDTWKLSDLNIKPQQASQYSLGLYKNFSGNLYELSLEGYYKKSKNILDYKTGANLFLNKYIETEVLQGEGKSYGVEFLVKKTEGRLNGWLGYSYSRSLIKFNSEFSEEQVNNGEYFASNIDKPHDVSLIANYKLTKRYSFSTNLTYQTGRPITYPVGKYIYKGSEHVIYSDRNKFRIPDYYRVDIGFNIEGNHKIKKFAHSFWNISIYNVLGRNNPYSVYFINEDNEIKAYKSSIFSIPIPTITYNFKF